METFDHKAIEKKWQERWEREEMYVAKENLEKKKTYFLVEFPYPSGAGLHTGHVRSYTAMDVLARKRRMQDENVLYPIGWDAFGLPTENYAIKTGRNPRDVTKENTDTFRRQLKSLGISFDWSREINTTDPDYYKWTQWIFIQMFKKGLAYKAKTFINWCPKDKIGLANEEVVDGACERCGTPVEKREKEQWMLAITKYAQRLYDDLDTVDYIERAKTQQRNWIGPSQGAEIDFEIKSFEKKITVFTTRPDTLFGATYLVLAPEHASVEMLKKQADNEQEVDAYIAASKKKSDIDRTAEGKEKTGVALKGIKAINPATKEEIPIWIADYVLAQYGTGAIMAVPAHDVRDFEFAKRYSLPVKPVILKQAGYSHSFVMGVSEEDMEALGVTIAEKTEDGFFKILIPYEKLDAFKAFIRERMQPHFWNEFSTKNGFYFIFKHSDGKLEEMSLDETTNDHIDEYGMTFNDKPKNQVPENVFSWLARNSFYKELLVHTGTGVLVNSGTFNGLSSEEAKQKITESVGGKIITKYKLRDWVFSRQRYWGEPIPMVHCEKDSWVPVPESELPVKLPEVEKYEPTDTGESPLATMTDWVRTTCPTCGGEATRETDVMPNWAGSSWYYLRYTDSHNDTTLADPAKLKYWTPVDWYNGGMEHTVLHLLYSRFWHKFLFDIGMVPTSEPYQKRTSHGLILAQGGEKMSKSKGNVVNPDEIVDRFGADALRIYEMFMGPFDQAIAWATDGLVGAKRFLERVYALKDKVQMGDDDTSTPLAQYTIKKVSEDIELLKMNTALSQIMIYSNELGSMEHISRGAYETLLVLLAPFAPHMTEELWSLLGHATSIHTESWPVFDAARIASQPVTIAVQVNGKTRGTVEVKAGTSEAEVSKQALALPLLQKHTEGQAIKKTIYVKERVINFILES